MNKQQTLLAGLVLLGISTAQSAPIMPMNNFGTGITPWNTAPGGYSPWNNGFNNGWSNGGYNGYPTGMFGMPSFGNGGLPWGNGSNYTMPWNAWRSGSIMPWSNFSDNGFNRPWGGGYSRGYGLPWGNGFSPWNSWFGRNNQFGYWNNGNDVWRNRWLMQGMPALPVLPNTPGAALPMYSTPLPQPSLQQQQVQQEQAANPPASAQAPRPFNAFAPQPKSAQQQGIKPGPAMPANIPAFRDPFAGIDGQRTGQAEVAPTDRAVNPPDSQPAVQSPEQSQLQFPPDDLFK